MKQILIVDDDRYILEGLSSMLRRHREDIEITCCENGQAALELLRLRDFDLMITDVMMPEVNGLSLIEKMAEQGGSVPVIVVSGYDDFSFAQRAVRFGACDYLLKPVRIEELLAAVNRALQRKRIAPAVPVDGAHLEQDAIRRVLIRQRSESLEHTLSAIGIDKSTDVVPVLATASERDADDVQNALRVRLRALRRCKVFSASHEGKVLLIALNVEEFLVKEALRGFASDHPNLEVSVCVGAHVRAEALTNAVERLEETLAARFFDITLAATHSASRALEGLSRAMTQLDVEAANHWLDAYLGAMIAQRANREYVVRGLIGWFYSFVGEMPEMIRIASQLNLTEFDFQVAIHSASSLSALRTAAQKIMKRYTEELLRFSDRHSLQIERVKRYVRENLAGTVQIGDAAALVGMHPNYLSVLFKQYTKTSFRDFLRNERIGKARQLVLETNMKLYEVAEAVGYPDPAHFSRAFKQVTGVTPQSLLTCKLQKGDK